MRRHPAPTISQRHSQPLSHPTTPALMMGKSVFDQRHYYNWQSYSDNLTIWQPCNRKYSSNPHFQRERVEARVGWCCWRICIKSLLLVISISTRLFLLISEIFIQYSYSRCQSWFYQHQGGFAGLGCVVLGWVVYCVVSELVGLAVLDQDWLPEGSAWRFALLLRLPLTPMGQGLEYVELWKVGKWIIAETKNVCLCIKMVVVVFVLLLVLHNVLFFDVNTCHSRSRKCFDLLKQ